MLEKISNIKDLIGLISPTKIDQNKLHKDNYRKNYANQIRALTIYIFKKLSDDYDFLDKDDRYHLLLPVLGFISGEWATYIINYYYCLKDIKNKNQIILDNSIIKYVKDNIDKFDGCNSYDENSKLLIDSNLIRVLITSVLVNNQKINKKIKNIILRKNQNLNLKNHKRKELNFTCKNYFYKYFRNLKHNNQIFGYKFFDVLKILIYTFKNDVKDIYEMSKEHTNKFIDKNLEDNLEYLADCFNQQQLDLIKKIIELFIPKYIKQKSIKNWIYNKKFFNFLPIKFCGPYVRNVDVIKNIFLHRYNKKLIIGSQHGSDYGYSFNCVKTEFSEFLLDGYISAGFTSENTNWAIPFLGFFPISPLYARYLKDSKNKYCIKSNFKSALYIESQFDLNKTMTSDRMNYSLTYSKYKTYNLIKNFLKNLQTKRFNRLYIKKWVQKEKISPIKDCKLRKSLNIHFVNIKLTSFIKNFNGLIILDDLSTPMCECIALNKPILIIISRVNENTKDSDIFFKDMKKNKFIVSNLEEANNSIKKFQANPKEYLNKQKDISEQFRKNFCNPNYYNPEYFAKYINNLLSGKIIKNNAFN